MSKPPLVSVILRVFDGERFLGTAIESLIQQTLDDFEVIVVEDGSTDASFEIGSSYAAQDSRIRIVRLAKNSGVAGALNTGLACASGRFVAILDHDDIALPERLEVQVEALSNEDRIVGSTMVAIDDAGHTLGYLWYPETSDQIRFGLCFQNEIGHSSVMYRADMLTRYGLRYDDDAYPAAEDYALWAAASQFTGFHNIRQPLVKYRIHRAQMSSQHALAQRDSADRISAGLLRSVLPELVLSFPDRHVLNMLYGFCLRKQLPFIRLPDFLPTAELGLASPMDSGAASGIETIRYRRLLRQLLQRFMAQHGTRDAALQHLCSDGS